MTDEAQTAPPTQGARHARLRAHNERLVLTLVRARQALTKAEIARLTGLAPQTVSVIMRQLEAEGLLQRGEPLRGRIGQPSVPLSLDPDGAYVLGVKIGRRSAEAVLLDFCGAERLRRRTGYRWPTPQDSCAWLRDALRAAEQHLGDRADRLAGLGIAMPFRLWEWAGEADAPPGAMEGWRDFDIAAALSDTGLAVHVVNDASAACAAELLFGDQPLPPETIYFYVGTFIGGGLVQGGRLVTGPTGNAGALGSMLVADARGRPVQLIAQASIILLERSLAAAGIAPQDLHDSPESWSAHSAHVQPWLDRAARAIAHATVSATAVTSARRAVIDGPFPRHIHELLLDKVARHIDSLDTAGLQLPEIRRGTLGPAARAVGAASLPLTERFQLAAGTMRAAPFDD